MLRLKQRQVFRGDQSVKERRGANINHHVVRLHRFLPFSTAHDQIYEEYQTGEDNLDLETVAISYAADAIRAGARCIVLTGDAGHGKTHMCRRLIEEAFLGYDGVAAREHLRSHCDGSLAIPPAAGRAGVKLRVHKDLSEMKPPSRAAAFLEAHGDREDEALVICANEGRLRAIVSSEGAGVRCHEIAGLFQRSFERGVTATPSGKIHIVNLNYQSIAANPAERGSLLRRVLESWIGDGRRWGERSCGTCIHEPRCPIRRNRAMLAEAGELSAKRVERMQQLFEVVERLGYVITVREMLMLVAYLITGGLSCRDVDKKLASGAPEVGWQAKWAYYNLLFSPPPNVPADRVEKGIPVLATVRRLDPGAVAIRRIDERILNLGDVFDRGELDLQFIVSTGGNQLKVDASLGIDDFNGNPQSKADVAREAEAAALAVAALRRRAFYDDIQSDGSVMSRLGFRHGDVFLRLLQDALPAPEKVKVKNTIIAGLHAIQGLRMPRTETTLHLVDPAFGRASADAAIIARQVPGSMINLQPASRAWIGGGEEQWFLPHSVDWIDRAVVLTVDEKLGELRDLALDLLSFECVGRAASGYVDENFYANEIRRIRTFLGQLAERGRGDDGQISVFMSGRLQNVSLDMDVIQVGGQ